MTPQIARARCAAGVLLLGAVLASRDGFGSCNVIPGTTQAFRASRTTIDRPFASPGEFLTLGLDPTCSPLAGEFSARAADHVLTVVFTPPHAGPRNVVALAADCAALEPARQACAARADVASARCLRASVGSGAPDLVVVDPRHLRVRFPDTDPLFLDPADGLTFSGPATLAVTRVGEALPCALASSPCAGQAGLLACVDDLLAGGTCAPVPHEVFGHFTALPFPNDYQALCTDPSPPCTGLARDIRFTVDSGWNLLIPMDWRGVLVNRNAVPVPRLLRASTPLKAFERSGRPIRIPDPTFLGSFSSEGRKLPPVFDPQANPEAVNDLTLFGSADAPEGVLRVARRSETFTACAGGANDGLPCVADANCGPAPGGTCGPATCTGGSNGQPCRTDADCPGGECGPGLFDLSSRLARGVGPVVVRLGACVGGTNALAPCAAGCPGGACGDFALAALDPVPLDGLNQSAELNAFVMEEPIENADLNGDGDATDHVVGLQDRSTGLMQAIGTGSGATQAHGRAVARIRQPPFSFPAVAVEGDVVAFLEPEPAQGGQDRNGNGTVFETILRVFRLSRGELTTDDRPITADAAPVINGRSVVVSSGLVFFRTAEAAAARQRTAKVVSRRRFLPGVRKDLGYVLLDVSGPLSISGDGRFVVARRRPRGLLVHDGVAQTSKRLHVASRDAPGRLSLEPVISADGRFVAFTKLAIHRVRVRNGTTRRSVIGDVFVHDRRTGVTERVSVASDGTQASDSSGSPSISADGRFVAFASAASNLVPGDTNGATDLFVRDRMTGVTERVSVHPSCPSISADGRFVAFLTGRRNFSVWGTGILVYDRVSRVTERLDVAPDGTPSDDVSHCPSISADGRFVAFASLDSNLVPGDTNGVPDIFVRDRLSGVTERVSVASDDTQGNDGSHSGEVFWQPGEVFVQSERAISADGRFVVFEVSPATSCRATRTPGGPRHGAARRTRVDVASAPLRKNAYRSSAKSAARSWRVAGPSATSTSRGSTSSCMIA